MADDRLRKLERLVAASSDPEAKAALLVERVRLGRITEQMVRLASVLGDSASLLLHPARVGWKPRDFGTITQGEMLGYLGALGKEKALEFVLLCLEHEFFQTMEDEYSVPYVLYATFQEMRRQNINFTTSEYSYNLIDQLRADSENHNEFRTATVAFCILMVIDSIRNMSGDERQAFRNLDNALSEATDTSPYRNAEIEYQKRLLIAFLVGDK